MKKFLLMTLCVLAAMSASAVDTFYINDFTINPGETKLIEINLDNDSVYTALQADIFLPEGLTIEQEDGDYLFELTDRKGRDHTIASTMLSSGAIRILIASQTLKTFKNNSGALVTFNIIADNSFSGPKTIQMRNIIATDDARVKHYMPNQVTTVTQEGYTPPTPTGDADCFYINDFSIEPGETKLVEINLDNDSVYTALQADIYLPEGLTIEQEDGDYLFDLTSRKGRDHVISSNMLSSGAIRILIASQGLKTFNGSGEAGVVGILYGSLHNILVGYAVEGSGIQLDFFGRNEVGIVGGLSTGSDGKLEGIVRDLGYRDVDTGSHKRGSAGLSGSKSIALASRSCESNDCKYCYGLKKSFHIRSRFIFWYMTAVHHTCSTIQRCWSDRKEKQQAHRWS